MTRILLLGKNGQIGWELHHLLQPLAETTALGSLELDITQRQMVVSVCRKIKPDIVINATGYNDVDAAETNIKQAISVNVDGNANLAEAARQTGAFYITYSTDYVFDGQKTSAYTEDDPVAPLNVYGRTKLDGELAIQNSGANFLIIRTSSVFSLRKPCFLSNFLKRAQPGAQIRVRTDLISSPTSAHYLAETTAQIIATGYNNHPGFLLERGGLYHFAGLGSASRSEWARETQQMLQLKVELEPASSLDFPSSAVRPAFSALDSSKFGKTFNVKLASWQKLLEKTLKDPS